MWMAVATDITMSCDSMSTEGSWTIWRKFFGSAAKAKEYCVRDYKLRVQIKNVIVLWKERRNNHYTFECYSSFPYVMYDVIKIEMEKG